MSLLRMGMASESVRFLDDVDLTFSLDNRSSSAQQMTRIEIAVNPVVFRASYRDINMITSIINKAVLLYGNSQNTSRFSQVNEGPTVKSISPKDSRFRGRQTGKARVLMSKEQVSFLSPALS